MTEHHFETHDPVELFVENARGRVAVHAEDTTETRVVLTGPAAEETDVELDGRRLRVVAPRHRGGLLGGDRRLDVTVTLPTGSALVARLGSADLRTTGTLDEVQVRTGSGETVLETVGDTLVETGSGDVEVTRAEGPLRVKSGSGDVLVRAATAEVAVSTGSGDVAVGEAGGPASVKTGSGDLRIGRARAGVGLSTGSGDLQVEAVDAGRVKATAASGDVRVGVPAGVPVWTDVSTVTGRIHSTLEGAGQPEDGAPYVELHVRTVSGDIALSQL